MQLAFEGISRNEQFELKFKGNRTLDADVDEPNQYHFTFPFEKDPIVPTAFWQIT